MTFDEVGGTGESSREVVTFPAVAASMTEPHFSTGTGVYHALTGVCGSASGTMHSRYTQTSVPHKEYMVKRTT